MRALFQVTTASAVALIGWGEFEHWRASKRGFSSPVPAGDGPEAIVVLGYRNRGRRANAVNRWRVRAALRSMTDTVGGTALVLCGGPSWGEVAEAELMAAYARDDLGYRGPLVIEPDSRTTWENVVNAIPLIEGACRIKIVSHSLHAEKACAYLGHERPDLAPRLVRADDYRIGEWLLLKPYLALDGRRQLRRIAALRTVSDRPHTV